MQRDQTADFVAGILTRHEVPFETSEDGTVHQVRSGSTAIQIRFADWGNDTVVTLMATVLEGLTGSDSDDPSYVRSLSLINDLNSGTYFGKFYRTPTAIALDHDLMADKMQAEELMNALDVVATLADHWDDKLKESLGGKSWAEVEEDAGAAEALEV